MTNGRLHDAGNEFDSVGLFFSLQAIIFYLQSMPSVFEVKLLKKARISKQILIIIIVIFFFYITFKFLVYARYIQNMILLNNSIQLSVYLGLELKLNVRFRSNLRPRVSVTIYGQIYQR